MSNTSPSRTGRLYLAYQSAFGTAATLTGANACRHITCKIKNSNPREPRKDKTGTLSPTPGIGGFRLCDVEISMGLAAGDTAGTPPDCAPILTDWFNGGPAIATGASCTWAPTPTNDGNALKGCTVGYFRLPVNMVQVVAHSVCFSELRFPFNDGVIAGWTAKGQGVWAVSNKDYATMAANPDDSVGLGGISSAPVEPSTPVTHGGVGAAYKGTISLASTSVGTLKRGEIILRKAITMEQSFGTAYPTSATPGLRQVGMSFSLKDDDSAMLAALEVSSIVDAVIAGAVQINTVPGNIWTFNVGGLQLSPPTRDDSGSLWLATWDEAPASSSAIAVTDEVTLVTT